MNIEHLHITDDVADKIARKHEVSVDEVYEVFWNDQDLLLIRRSSKVRGTYVALGRTFAGRYLMVAFRPRGRGVANILTARDMDHRERKLYRG